MLWASIPLIELLGAIDLLGASIPSIELLLWASIELLGGKYSRNVVIV